MTTEAVKYCSPIITRLIEYMAPVRRRTASVPAPSQVLTNDSANTADHAADDLINPHRLVECEPEVGQHALRSGDGFVIMATDGLWDVLTDQEAVDTATVRPILSLGVKRSCSS